MFSRIMTASCRMSHPVQLIRRKNYSSVPLCTSLSSRRHSAEDPSSRRRQHQHEHQHQHQQLGLRAPFSSSSKQHQQPPLMNAALIRHLMESSSHPDPSSFPVRLVVDHGGGQRNPMVVVSLAQAAQTAVDLDLDLMGIQLKQDPPVLRAQSMEKLKYKGNAGATAASSNSTSSKPSKEIKFKAGIADHDLERKAAQITGYLEKGHACQVTLQASQFKLKLDATALQTTLSRVVEIVGDAGEMAGKMKLGREGGLMTMMLVPPSKESKQKAKKKLRLEVKETTDQETPPSLPMQGPML